MPKIDFYILTDTALNAHFHFACRLVEKAYEQKHALYIHTLNKAEAEHMDQLLWTFKDDSFIPHALYEETFLKNPPPIQIGYLTKPQDHRDILLNLSHDVPSFYQAFERVLEVVSGHPDQQKNARERYRFYRDNGCDIATHKL